MTHPIKAKNREAAPLFWFLAIILVILLLRNFGLNPTIFSDEYTYNVLSRLSPISEATIPGYLYLAVYRFSSLAGSDFLNLVRLFNVLFYVGAGAWVYLVARRVSGPKTATLVSLLAVLGAANTYTAYFMPESMFFFGFWLFIYAMIRLDARSSPLEWVIAGVALGAASLIKPHALFFVPAILLYIAYLSVKGESRPVGQVLRNIALFMVPVFLVKFFVGFIFAGKAGVTLFGPLYGSVANSATGDAERYILVALAALRSLEAHVQAMLLVCGLSFTYTIFIAIQSLFGKGRLTDIQRASVLTTLIAANLLCVTALFTASVAGSGPYESIGRIHMRYYNFILPLFFIIAASKAELAGSTFRLKWRIVAGLLVGGGILYATMTLLQRFYTGMVDSPELKGLTATTSLFYPIIGLSLFSTLLWVWKPRAGMRLFVYVLLPISVSISSILVSIDLRHRIESDAYDHAGTFTREYLPDALVSRVVVAGSEPAALYRTLFHLDNPDARVLVLEPAQPLDLKSVPSGKDWVLVVGDHPVPANVPQIKRDGFTLLSLVDGIEIDFSQPYASPVVHQISGVSAAEGWGVWADKRQVDINFFTSLPEHFQLVLKVRTSAANAGKEVRIIVGGRETNFALSGEEQEVRLNISNPDRASTITFDTSASLSSMASGVSEGKRSSGVGLVHLSVIPMEDN